jgi:hypothetical protein
MYPINPVCPCVSLESHTHTRLSLAQTHTHTHTALFIDSSHCNSANNTYSLCVHALTTIHAYTNPSIDLAVAQRVTLTLVMAALDSINAPNPTDLYVDYDYPIPVQASILLTLQGADRVMTADETYLFLKTLRSMMKPVLMAGSYEWTEEEAVQVVLQLAAGATKTTNDTTTTTSKGQRQLQQSTSTTNGTNDGYYESDPDAYSEVELLVRAICAGPATCLDDNFRLFLKREINNTAFRRDLLTTSVQTIPFCFSIGSEKLSSTTPATATCRRPPRPP